MLEKMKKVAAGMGAFARASMPEGLERALLDLAQEVDRLRAEVEQLKAGK